MTDAMLGCPFHGAVIDGKLTLPNTQEMDYPQPFTDEVGVAGNVQRLRNPTAPPIVRTPEQQARDFAKGYRWKDYNLVSAESTLCGRSLGTGWHIYIDGNGIPWAMAYSFSVDGTGVHANLTLINVFGRVPGQTEDVDTSLLSATFALPNGRDSSESLDYASLPAPYNVERNGNGSVMLMHLYLGDDDLNHLLSVKPRFPYDVALDAVYKIEISGNGNISDPGQSLGQGIAAAMSLHKDLDDIEVKLVDENTSFTVDGQKRGCQTFHCGPATWGLLNWNIVWLYTIRMVFDADDNEIALQHKYGNQLVTTRDDVITTACDTQNCVSTLTQESITTRRHVLCRNGVEVTVFGTITETVFAESETVVTGPKNGSWPTETHDDNQIRHHWNGTLIYERIGDENGLISEYKHPDGNEARFGPALLSPQVLAGYTTLHHDVTLVTKGKLGESIAAEAEDDTVIDIGAYSFGWWLAISGTYEPEEKTIATKADGKVCYV